MRKPQTRFREPSSIGRQQIRFQLVREGEPLPSFAPLRIAKPRRRKDAVPVPPSMDAEPHCPLCDVVITRFDAGVYADAGRCGPCHEALEDE
jgi:hypothetical protein